MAIAPRLPQDGRPAEREAHWLPCRLPNPAFGTRPSLNPVRRGPAWMPAPEAPQPPNGRHPPVSPLTASAADHVLLRRRPPNGQPDPACRTPSVAARNRGRVLISVSTARLAPLQQKQTDSEVPAAKGGRRTGCAGEASLCAPATPLPGISRYVHCQRTQAPLAVSTSFLALSTARTVSARRSPRRRPCAWR